MGWDTIIWIGIAVVVTAGSAIGNWMKQRAEREKAQQAADRRRHSAGSTGKGDLDDVAARRREQLRQMSQRQQSQARAGGVSGGAAGGGEPTNLTMAERIARARAKAQYEQRAEGLRDRGRSEPAQTPRAEGESQAAADRRREQAQLEQRRRQQQAQRRQREAAESRAEQQQRAQQAQQRQRQQAAQRQKQLAQQRAAAQRRQRAESMRVAEEHGPIDAGESVVQRHVPDAEPVPVPELIEVEPVSLSKMNRASWRRAIILKEVLDRPVALRDSASLAGL